MRKIYSFMVAAVAVFAAASCAKELPQENLPAGETVVYSASFDQAETKAVLNETKLQSEWVAGDAITVLDGAKAWNFTTTQAGTDADFANSEGFGEYRPVVAVYPKGAWTANLAEKTVNAYIATWQQAQKGTYHADAALAVAYSENNEFSFKNAHALLKFQVNADNVTHLVFHGNNEEAFTGNMLVTLGDDNTIASVVAQDTEFTEGDNKRIGKGTWVECYAWQSDDEKYFEKGATYYIAVAPQVFENGVSVKIRINEGAETLAKTTTKKVEVKRNTIVDLGVIEYVAPEPDDVTVQYWAVVGSMTNNWASEVKMTLDGDWYVAENVTILKTDQFKFRANGSWDAPNPNRGAEAETDGVVIANDTETKVVQDGKNFSVVADGIYTLSINKTADKAKVVKTGEYVAPENPKPEEPTPSTPGEQSEWALVGAFNGWKDQSFLTTEVSNVVVLKGVAMKAAEGFLVRKPSTDWADKHGAGNVNYIKKNNYIETVKDGGDMCLEADGTYDIYFNTDTKALYAMAAGVAYTTATKQTVSGEEPKQEEPEVTDKVLYLKPNSNWTQSNARFAIYIWGGTAGEKWVSMTAVGDGTYQAHIPEGYDYGCNVIFCRMNPGTTANNWNNKWNQTSDLKAPTDGKNLYTVKDGTWDKGGGTWSVK
jgi:hypothetical protein